jgi:ABC-type multidrug transport system ATPase subunit
VMDSGRIITCDKPRRLIESLSLSATIQARSSGSSIPLELVRTIPGVTNVAQNDGQILISTIDVPYTMTRLLELAQRVGVKFDSLTTSGATLEDVFLHHTGRRLRD